MKTRFFSTKLLTALMILCLVLLLAPVSVFAAEPAAATADFTAADNGAAAIQRKRPPGCIRITSLFTAFMP